MKWSRDAQEAIKKVPFFIRKKVKKKVEAFAAEKEKHYVDLADVDELKSKFLAKGGMESHIKGYEVTTCFGGDCPNTANSGTRLAGEIEEVLKKENILGFLKVNVKGDLKFHHEFRVVLADCPNACSRPQIVDIGIIGSVLPQTGDEPCTLCGSCADTCRENAIALDGDKKIPQIDYDLCLMCAGCISACPTGTMKAKEKGFRVLLGGRLGRHPRLAMEVPGLLDHERVMQIVKNSVKFYKKHSRNGKRFSHILSSVDQVVSM